VIKGRAAKFSRLHNPAKANEWSTKMGQARAKLDSEPPKVNSQKLKVLEKRVESRKRRVSGTGGIFEKKGSRFLYISYRDVNGVLRQESTKSESLMVAENMLRDRLGKVEQGLPVTEMKRLRYEDIRETLIMDYRTRGVKMLEEEDNGTPYVWGFEHLDPFFKNRVVRTITTDLLYRFIEKRQTEGARNATINRNLSLLRRMMSLVRREGKLAQVPYFPMLKEDNVRQGFVTPVQFANLRKALPKHLHPLMTFLYFTGCRIGAARAITWSQIEFEKGRFQLRIEGSQTKNEEPILLPLPFELNQVLKKMSREGQVFDATNLRKSFQAACVKVGLGKDGSQRLAVQGPADSRLTP